MLPQFRVTLTKEEVEELQKISSTGSRSAKIVLFARALLLLDKRLSHRRALDGQSNFKSCRLVRTYSKSLKREVRFSRSGFHYPTPAHRKK